MARKFGLDFYQSIRTDKYDQLNDFQFFFSLFFLRILAFLFTRTNKRSQFSLSNFDDFYNVYNVQRVVSTFYRRTISRSRRSNYRLIFNLINIKSYSLLFSSINECEFFSPRRKTGFLSFYRVNSWSNSEKKKRKKKLVEANVFCALFVRASAQKRHLFHARQPWRWFGLSGSCCKIAPPLPPADIYRPLVIVTAGFTRVRFVLLSLIVANRVLAHSHYAKFNVVRAIYDP